MLDFSKINKDNIITIVGHSCSDADSIISSILVEKWLKDKGYNTKIKLLDEHVDECKEILNLDFKYDIGINKNDVLFIVDNSSKYENKIVACIDHHPAEPNNENYINRNCTSCAKIIYDLMLEDEYEFSKEEIIWICYSLFLDSCSFKSSKAKPEDLVWAKEQIKKYNLDYNWFFNNGLCLNKLEDPKEYCFYGFKRYTNKQIPSSYIQVKENTSEKFDLECIKVIKEFMKESLDNTYIFLIQNVYEENTKCIIITNDVYYTINFPMLMSRGVSVIPFVEKYLKNPNNFDELVNILIKEKITVSTMESCTSGLVASTITDTKGASEILKGAYVTYSNVAKTLQGVKWDTINTYGVYSYETAIEMAEQCALSYNADIGIGVTGTIDNVDKNNPDSTSGEIYICIKYKEKKYTIKLTLKYEDLKRKEMKEIIVGNILHFLELIV